MANYTIDRSLTASGSVTVTEATVNTDTNVSLVGQNFTGYGGEIATNFLQMLENFAADAPPNANPRVPGSSAITGQLWYDTAESVLKVYSGTGWVEQAQAVQGSVESSTLRWNNTNGLYQPEERVRVSDAGSLLIDNASAGTNAVTFNHGGTDFTATFAGTTDFTISGLTGDLTVTGGRGLSVENGSTALAIRAGGSNDINFTAASANTMNLPAGVKLITAAATTTRAGIQIPEMIGTPAAPVDGDLWVTAAGNFYARLNGSTVDLAAAAGGTVTSTGSPANNEVAVWTAVSDQLEGDANFTWNGTTMNVTGAITATSFGGIPSANLINRTAPGTISGVSTITADMNFSTADLTLDDADFIRLGTGNDVTLNFSGTDLELTGTGSLPFTSTGFSIAQFNHQVSAQQITTNPALKVVGNANTWSTTNSNISFYDSDQSEQGLQIGTTSGSTTAVVNSLVGQLDLYASNVKAVDIKSFAQTFYASGNPTGLFQSAFTANHSTSLLIYDQNGESHPAGINGSPLADHVLDDINTGSRIVSLKFIGKMVSRTTSTSRSFTLNNLTTIPVGATILCHNGTSSGTFTIVQGTATLEWVDGSGSSPVTGTRTLANNSVATLRKKANTATNVWQIWGNGIS